MYFAILGRHPGLSLAEFALIPTISLRRQGAFLFFATDLSESAVLERLEKLAGIVKRGTVVEHALAENEKIPEIEDFISGVELVGANTNDLGMTLKKQYGMKRYKLVELTSTDLEVKKAGKELIDLGSEQIGLVLGRQDIAHFELIDFAKPARGMEIGMMPAKLTQILINIGITKLGDTESANFTIYDPFCGFGTTGLVANWLGQHFIGSDLIITGAKENAKRRTQAGGKKDLYFTIFKHDVKEPFDHPVLKNIDVIVTEGRLGPVVSKQTREPELRIHAEKIIELYRAFLTHISSACPEVPVVMTVPHYTRLPELLFAEITQIAQGVGYTVADLGIYSRAGQAVCRQVVSLVKIKN